MKIAWREIGKFYDTDMLKLQIIQFGMRRWNTIVGCVSFIYQE